MHHLLENDKRYPRILMIEENVIGHLVQRNAYFSRVKYSILGHEYNIEVDNDEYLELPQIGYESD
ncbi:hypothetical protein SEA_ANNADREAMY_163 [Streptomyces phage Annadreamy]|uniref:Uncharacterized protein n=2 Tax=Annadreamyvirus annadreamy TaxID=2846392 RepID=A0A345GTI2_9CAUD|nr:hypothetical protein HWB75_gp109 [Streptomyces phage Annadreamy]AXG66254.1 hypothetical protein SEA_ANNADREAMY_163 [Streptomyces phage Annadreamy]QGH79477.1 hypothetical protein SEA_LIMPID_170 [Streptomyces phage Limpid]QOI67543.1 hypothetical protein SEA_BEUFFERT_169 [Streptomyces phage Beuffert]